MSGLAYKHQRVQRLRKLVSRRAAREEEGRFVLEGVNLLEEALGAGTPIEALYLEHDWARGSVGPGDQAAPDRLSALVEQCYLNGTRVFELEDGVLARVAGTVTPQPVMAVAEMGHTTLDELLAGRPSLVVVCVDVRDPGNAGTVARCAWASGADGVVCCQGTVDLWNPKAVRASAGAIVHLPVVRAGGAREALEELGSAGIARWGTVPTGGKDYATLDFSGPCALVLGNEASGLPVHELEPVLDGLVSIPMASGAESLNVGMAAAVLCFEAARQRRAHQSGASRGAP